MEQGAIWSGHWWHKVFLILMMCTNIQIQVNVHLRLRLTEIGQFIQNGRQIIKFVKKWYIGHKHSLIYDWSHNIPLLNLHQHVFIITDKKKAAEIQTKWPIKWLKLEGKMCTGYIMAVGKVPLLFLHSWTTQEPESTCWSSNCRCFTEIWQKCTLYRFWEIERITHFCPPSNQIWSYINICNINRKLLTQAFTWI